MKFVCVTECVAKGGKSLAKFFSPVDTCEDQV